MILTPLKIRFKVISLPNQGQPNITMTQHLPDILPTNLWIKLWDPKRILLIVSFVDAMILTLEWYINKTARKAPYSLTWLDT